MSWIVYTLGGYFFNAVTSIFDKFLLSGRIKEPCVYAFYVSIFSLFAVVFVPFGVQWIPWQTIVVFVISGVFFLYGLVAFYNAVKRSEISRVAPLVGITTAVIAAVASLAFGPAANLSFSPLSFFSLFLLLGGAFLIAFDLPLKPNDALMKSTLLAGALMALSLIFLKTGYRNADFINGLVWSRLGFVIGGVSLFFIPEYRTAILDSTHAMTETNKENFITGSLFILNKVFGAISTFLLTYAAYLGPITFIQALNGIQYAFVLLLALPLSFYFPQVFGEKLLFWDWVQKVVAVFLIGIGMWLAVHSGVNFLFL